MGSAALVDRAPQGKPLPLHVVLNICMYGSNSSNNSMDMKMRNEEERCTDPFEYRTQIKIYPQRLNGKMEQ